MVARRCRPGLRATIKMQRPTRAKDGPSVLGPPSGVFQAGPPVRPEMPQRAPRVHSAAAPTSSASTASEPPKKDQKSNRKEQNDKAKSKRVRSAERSGPQARRPGPIKPASATGRSRNFASCFLIFNFPAPLAQASLVTYWAGFSLNGPMACRPAGSFATGVRPFAR